MYITLQNSFLTLQLQTLGAQLLSIQDTAGREYLWQGRPEVWGRRAPILFPVIGRLRNGAYTLQGRPFSIPMHGFARDLLFSVIHQTPTQVTLQLTDTSETLAMYPFSFRFTVTYTLEDERLIKSHRVENLSPQPMPYELGGHDGFALPLSPQWAFEEYAILLPGLDHAISYGANSEALVTPRAHPIALKHHCLSPLPSSYGLDTIILDCPPQGRVLLLQGDQTPIVEMDCHPFPYLAIWTAMPLTHQHFICLEPWTTLPDATFVSTELTDKQGIRILEPEQSESLSYSITFPLSRGESTQSPPSSIL